MAKTNEESSASSQMKTTFGEKESQFNLIPFKMLSPKTWNIFLL